MRIGVAKLARTLGISRPSVYRRLASGYLPEPFSTKPLEWDTDFDSYKEWSTGSPGSPQGRKLFVSAGELAELFGVTPQAISRRLARGTFPPWECEFLGERLWRWTMLNPFLNRLKAQEHGWNENFEAGQATPLPFPGEPCFGIRGSGPRARPCKKESVYLSPDENFITKPYCGLHGNRKYQAMRVLDAELLPIYNKD